MIRRLLFLGFLLFPLNYPGAETLEEALEWSRSELEAARKELSQARDTIVDEKLPLARGLREVREALVRLRAEKRLLDEQREGGGFELGQLKSRNSSSGEMAKYLGNQAIRYRQSFEADLVSGERRAYSDTFLEMDKVHVDASSTMLERAELQWQVIVRSLDRLDSLLGGSRFSTAAISPDGILEAGTAIQFGPFVFFGSPTGESAGNLHDGEGLEPKVKILNTEHQAAVRSLLAGGSVRLPIDPTLGQATLIEDEAVSLGEHLVRGGFWMIPICLFGVCALVASLLKWRTLRWTRFPGIQEFEEPGKHSIESWADRYGRDVRQLFANVHALKNEPPELQAAGLDMAYQEFKFRLNRWLPLIALTAAVSPLLGLLGTVTGMIKTFQLISIFGAGDAKLLSSGISEALITTEFGLVVAIPALVLHAWLQRRVKKILVRSAHLMEQLSRGVTN